MIIHDIRLLLQKLNPACTSALERAVGYCVNRGNYEVRWEHLLFEFLQHSDNDIHFILKHFGIDSGLIREDVQRDLEKFSSGNTGKPVFSPPLVDMLEQAWVYSSLNYNFPCITSGSLFIAACETPQFVLPGPATLLEPLRREKLKTEFLEITAGFARKRVFITAGVFMRWIRGGDS